MVYLPGNLDLSGEEMEGLDPLGDELFSDDSLSPLEKLDKYFQSEEIGDRWVLVLLVAMTSICINVHSYVYHAHTHAYREQAVHYITETAQSISNFAEFELLLETALALAQDHGTCTTQLEMGVAL